MAMTVGDLIKLLEGVDSTLPIFVAGASETGWDWSYHESAKVELTSKGNSSEPVVIIEGFTPEGGEELFEEDFE